MRKELDPTSIESSELVEETFDFWFRDREHIRSPFPEYIQPKLKQASIERFFSWTSKLQDEAEKEITDYMIGERFEEILFETALELVQTEDEKLTIYYPFMPRIGDVIEASDENNGKAGTICDRSILKEGDRTFMKVVIDTKTENSKWETRFEIPA
ncbi:MAG: hypothetical protein H6585_03030 [Flavobacteriales bacterium]|nr:hypothetical protein [Flavobacteriales bacterium]MCB9447301.1 hypothetical protein [Flavobacteriales bacterium]